ncbi:uncharacterized protein METZ01_LOCUS125411 [marine metagenome]|uniref:Uncharacterized protein n=1 Tax=marine metagenome TaxID=408172 RepID=A0A381Y822_9ZZZZ
MLLQILLEEPGDLLELGLVPRVGIDEGLMCIQAGASEIGFVQRCNLLHRFGSSRLAKRIGRAEQLEDAQVVEKDANRFRWLVE